MVSDGQFDGLFFCVLRNKNNFEKKDDYVLSFVKRMESLYKQHKVFYHFIFLKYFWINCYFY